MMETKHKREGNTCLMDTSTPDVHYNTICDWFSTEWCYINLDTIQYNLWELNQCMHVNGHLHSTIKVPHEGTKPEFNHLIMWSR